MKGKSPKKIMKNRKDREFSKTLLTLLKFID